MPFQNNLSTRILEVKARIFELRVRLRESIGSGYKRSSEYQMVKSIEGALDLYRSIQKGDLEYLNKLWKKYDLYY